MQTKQITTLIRTLRKEKNFTQKQMARALNISVAQYGHYETGHSEMTISTFLRILQILSVDLTEFFGIVNSKITKDDINQLKAAVEQIENKLMF